MREYRAFLDSKAPRTEPCGVDAKAMGSHLFDFQKAVVEFSLKQGRVGNFLDTGLGKSRIQVEFCSQAAEATNGRALLLTPLAVAPQIAKEATALGYNARVIRDQSEASDGVNICNYDRLHLIDPDSYGAVSLDESSILKNFSGKQSRALINAFRNTRFRLAATATPAPNDHRELGQHAEFLGQMSSMEMLSRWFINDTSTASQQWRLKRAAVTNFWDWMATWSRAAQSPADLGYDGAGFSLPPLNVIRHKTESDVSAPVGALFIEDVSATNLHDLKRQTIKARAEKLAELVQAEPNEPWLIWVDTDYEADAVRSLLAGAVEVRGSHTPEKKEHGLMGFANGEVKILISKPSIAGVGMNYQHCARMAYVGRSFSYESFYQSVRRCWRFGQSRPVNVHLIVAEGEDQIGRVIDRKAEDHDTMKRAMAAAMHRNAIAFSGPKTLYIPNFVGEFPSWLNAAA